MSETPGAFIFIAQDCTVLETIGNTTTEFVVSSQIEIAFETALGSNNILTYYMLYLFHSFAVIIAKPISSFI